MLSITVIDLEGTQRQHGFTEGDSLMEVLREANYDEVQALCGGLCSCATCHVYLESQPKLLPAEENEQRLLELADNYQPGRSRLSCQIELTEQVDGLKVTLVAAG